MNRSSQLVLVVGAVAATTLATGTAHAQLLQEKPFEQSFVLGGNAYVNQWDQNRLTIVNAANPAQVIGKFDAMDVIESQTLAAPYFYVVTGSGVEIVDVSTPATPHLVATVLPLAGKSARWARVIGSRAYVTEWGNGWTLRVFDVSVPASPLLLGQRALTSGGSSSGGQISPLDAGHVVVGLYVGGPLVVGVGNPANMTIDATVPAQGCGGQIVKDGRLYLSCGLTYSTSQVVTFDLTNPRAPMQLGSLQLPRAAYDPSLPALAVRNGRTYFFGEVMVNDEEDLLIVDVTNASSPQLTAILRLQSGGIDYEALDIDVQGQTAWINCVQPPHWPITYFFFVAEVDITTPAAPVLRAIRAVPRLP